MYNSSTHSCSEACLVDLIGAVLCSFHYLQALISTEKCASNFNHNDIRSLSRNRALALTLALTRHTWVN